MTRLTLDITEQQHQRITAMAALQGKSIEQYAMERLFPASPDEERALAELKALLSQRLSESLQGEVVSRSLSDIAEDVMKARGAA